MRRFLVSVAFSSAVAAGDYEVGRNAYDAGDFDKAMAVWAPAAESGEADSQYGMGLLYAEGIAVPMDDIQALKWFGLAADQGHGDAQYKLGVMHANGWGVPMDEGEAMKWYMLAAENGVTEAQVSLGTMYQNGFSVEQDKIEALKWFTVAVRLGDTDASVHQEYLTERMPAEEIAKADTKINAWFNDHQTMLAEGR
jgi:TPR repeat protein